MKRCYVAATLMMTLGSMAAAQQPGPPLGWVGAGDGFLSYQGETDLDGGGSFSANRAYLRAGGLYRFDSGHSAGLFVSAGQIDYDFDPGGVQPWDDIRDVRVSVPMRFAIGDGVNAFVVPSLRYDYETGVSMSDGQTHGVFAGVTWRLGNGLTIGPGLGVFTQIEDDDLNVFPALLIDWDITDRWNLSTGTGLGATQGPGISLSYAYSDALRVSIGARYEELRFRLDDRGVAPGGVGQDRSVPVVLALEYEPSPRMSLTAFAGAEFGGELQLEDRAGTVVSTQDYDTAPLVGFAFRFTF